MIDPTRLVVDASIAAKWLFEEEGSEAAERLLDRPVDLSAPDFLLLELGNVIWKMHCRGEISVLEGREALRVLRGAPVRIEPSVTLLEEAWEIAAALGRSVYDSIYLALAEARDARLVTADRRLLIAVAAGPLGNRVVGLEDV